MTLFVKKRYLNCRSSLAVKIKAYGIFVCRHGNACLVQRRSNALLRTDFGAALVVLDTVCDTLMIGLGSDVDNSDVAVCKLLCSVAGNCHCGLLSCAPVSKLVIAFGKGRIVNHIAVGKNLSSRFRYSEECGVNDFNLNI